MALTMLPDGTLTTTFLIEQERLMQESLKSAQKINEQVIKDAIKWRCHVATRRRAAFRRKRSGR